MGNILYNTAAGQELRRLYSPFLSCGSVIYSLFQSEAERGGSMIIYVWGTGCGAGDLIDTALDVSRVSAFVDEKPGSESFLGRPVISPGESRLREADLLIVTVADAEGVSQRCRELGIGDDRLFFLKNHLTLTERNRNTMLAEAALGKDYVEGLRGSERLIRRPLWTERERLAEAELTVDYVRLKTLEMLCGQIEGVPGAAAELGVYRGAFARCINALLPERTLFLFDSFEGFDERESAGEKAGFVQAHRNTAEEQVLAAMPHPERVILRRGFFPATAEGLEEERFALVSLDVDLEESTLKGLRFFVPRMEPGGYLLLHDCFSPKLPGVAAALRRYEAESGRRLHKVPVSDVNGTLVISA